MVLIGLTGKKRSGKDTTADYLVEKYGFSKMSFSTPLKDICKILFSFRISNFMVMKKKKLMHDGVFRLEKFYNLLGQILFEIECVKLYQTLRKTFGLSVWKF